MKGNNETIRNKRNGDNRNKLKLENKYYKPSMKQEKE